ncbi:hypothetical protein DPMN_183324 [Dreissena polymorpha]|uniref:Uncharacterized protein n=1 Tax=Dreissena polymorpha TaxID=45954 RepID=A0A9D4DI67_DREPO|nr:hypothetical protein DPMN_183324 [Dreissena polymorpha]
MATVSHEAYLTEESEIADYEFVNQTTSRTEDFGDRSILRRIPEIVDNFGIWRYDGILTNQPMKFADYFRRVYRREMFAGLYKQLWLRRKPFNSKDTGSSTAGD